MSEKNQEINRGARIAKNTIFLYARMIVSMLVTLYTSRVVLDVLGTSDFGVYNVVTGFVVAFGFLNNAMSASVQRFLTIEIKQNNYDYLNNIFNMGVIIHILLAVLIIAVAEPVGLYFVHNKLVIPAERMTAATWTFHFSVIMLFFGIMNVPYKALIVAHEDMGVYAGIGLFEVFAKLAIAFAITYIAFDKLIQYAAFLMFVAVLVQVFYMWYCIKKYNEGRFHMFWEKRLFKDMCGFAGWNLIGVFAGIAYNQGVNIILNIFGGPIVNTARAIAFQVSGAANQLVSNFQMAINPPIMKAYAQNDPSTFKLILSSAKLSYILSLLIVVPFVIEGPFILSLWLKEVPEYAIMFTRLALIDVLVCSLSGPIHVLVQATGKIRKYQMIISGILLLNMPFSYLFLKLGLSFDITFVVSILLSFAALVARVVLLKQFIDVDYKALLKHFLAPLLLSTILSFAICTLLQKCSLRPWLQLVVICCCSWVIVFVLSWFTLLNNSERNLLKKTAHIK